MQFGRAEGTVINEGASLKVAGLAFLITFALSCASVHVHPPRARGLAAGRAGGASAGRGGLTPSWSSSPPSRCSGATACCWSIGGVLAIGIGVKAMQGPTQRFGTASAQVVLDTPVSMLLDTAPVGADTLTSRAAVFGDLAETDPIASRIAERMGIARKDLNIKANYLAEPKVSTPLPTKALEAAAAAETPYVLSIMAIPDTPVISIDSSGPHPKDAVRLASAAVAVLKAEAHAHDGEPNVQPFVVSDLAPVRARTVTSGPRRVMGLVVAMFTFVFWCFGVMFVAALVRAAHYRVPVGLNGGRA